MRAWTFKFIWSDFQRQQRPTDCRFKDCIPFSEWWNSVQYCRSNGSDTTETGRADLWKLNIMRYDFLEKYARCKSGKRLFRWFNFKVELNYSTLTWIFWADIYSGGARLLQLDKECLKRVWFHESYVILRLKLWHGLIRTIGIFPFGACKRVTALTFLN